jgi:hypothetical protein
MNRREMIGPKQWAIEIMPMDSTHVPSAIKLFVLICTIVLLGGCAINRPSIDPVGKSIAANAADNLLANDWMKYRGTDDARLISSTVCAVGQKKTAFFVAFSGGGSRSAYFAANVLHELDRVGLDPITPKISGIFSVSGGSLAAALYGVSHDQAELSSGPLVWSQHLTDEVLTIDLMGSMTRKLAAPFVLLPYLFGDVSRTDLLEEAIERDVLLNNGAPLRYSDFNPNRPPIFINAAIATSEGTAAFAPEPFGAAFLFARPDFVKLGLDINSMLIARAVSASSAFPGLLSPVALPRLRQSVYERQLGQARFVHLIDGGNADNLGLLGIKRALLEDQHRILRDCDSIVVLSVDAFGRQGRHEDSQPVRSSPSGWFFDHNSALASFDALLAANRARLLGEFKSRVLMPPGSEELCRKDGLPDEVCGGGVRADWNEINQLVKKKLFFVHLNFQSPEIVSQTNVIFCGGSYGDKNSDCEVLPVDGARLACETRNLRMRLESIPTAFGLSHEESSDIRIFASLINHPKNICLQHIYQLVHGEVTHDASFYQDASASCDETSPVEDGRVLARKHIRGRVFGDVILKDNSKPFRPFSEYCASLEKGAGEERVRFLQDAKARLLASPRYLSD